MSLERNWHRVAPHILGNEYFKKFVCIQLFTMPESGEKFHILAIGDVASGKSDIGLSITKIMPQARYCSKKVTGVGLAEAVRDTDKGIVIVDELDKIEQEARNSLLECMQTGFITSDKFGDHQVIQARINILALCNPTSRTLSRTYSAARQIMFSMPLISRFHTFIPVYGVEPDKYERISVMKNDSSLKNDAEFQRFGEEIQKIKEETPEVRINQDMAIQIGRYVKSLKLSSPNREYITPRTIEGIQSAVKAIARMNRRCETQPSDFDEVKKLYEALQKR